MSRVLGIPTQTGFFPPRSQLLKRDEQLSEPVPKQSHLEWSSSHPTSFPSQPLNLWHMSAEQATIYRNLYNFSPSYYQLSKKMCHLCFVNKRTRHVTGPSRSRLSSLTSVFLLCFSNFNVPTLEARLEATLIWGVHVFFCSDSPLDRLPLDYLGYDRTSTGYCQCWEGWDSALVNQRCCWPPCDERTTGLRA